MRRILEKQAEKEAKILNFNVSKNSGITYRNNFKDSIKSRFWNEILFLNLDQIDILDEDRKQKYLQKLKEKELKYWETKQNERLRAQRFQYVFLLIFIF